MGVSNLPTPQQITEKQIRNTSASTQAYKDGVARVSQAPGQAAAAKKDKYLNGVQQNVGKWARNVAAVPLSVWQQAATDKGASRLSSGISAASDKVSRFWGKFLPFLSNVQTQVNAMPSDTFEQRLEKMNANARGLHNFSQNG